MTAIERGTWLPVMHRTTDPVESELHEATVPKGSRGEQILQRLADGSRQCYVTLCDFGQEGGPASMRTLLTHLERQRLVVKQGRIGLAAAFVITERGRQALR